MRLAFVIMAVGCASEPGAPVDARVWATYRISAGEHTAHVEGRVPHDPIDGVTSVVGRDYELVLDPSARYVLDAPVEPTDQLDWNKLPGLSDCGTTDLAVDGAMFGWRWRVDLTPQVLEVTAYANAGGVHLTSPTPLVTLDAAALDARLPLRYRIAREPAGYRFEVTGAIPQPIAVTATLPRRCAGAPLDPLAWAGSFYFGGTSPAPQEITAQIHEVAW